MEQRESGAEGPYTLPNLPYDYADLEPHISAAIMKLHHEKHHRAYVNGANEALGKSANRSASQAFAGTPFGICGSGSASMTFAPG